MLANALSIKIQGINCDAPTCDFRDGTVRYEDFEKWLNKPCPKCGANLLTDADLRSTRKLLQFVRLANRLLPRAKRGESLARVAIAMDGSGRVSIDLNKASVKA